MHQPRNVLRAIAMKTFNLVASDIHDVETGEHLGRALLVPWRGRIFLFGPGIAGYALVPKFCPQSKLSFWKCELGFTKHPKPDFPRESSS
jgi:hypothetical protein